MKGQSPEPLTVDQLVERYATLGVEQDKAEQVDNIARVNRLFQQLIEIEKELKNRPGDQRRALLTLYDYPNMNVRLKAAKATLAVAPRAARSMIESIAASTWPPQCYDAGMCLWALDEGIFVPK